MAGKRIIVCLDVRDGRIARPVQSAGGDAGDAAAVAQQYEADGADEIVVHDSTEPGTDRHALITLVQRVADRVTIPITVAGRIGDLDEIGRILQAGGNKVAINTAAILRPELLSEAAQQYGNAAIVASITARAERRQIEILARPEDAPADLSGAAPPLSWFRIFTHHGTTATQLDAIVWARRCAELGASEIMVSNIDASGARSAYDLELSARVVESVAIPVAASGNACRAQDVRDAFLLAGVDAAVVAHACNGADAIPAIKRMLMQSGIPVRDTREPEMLQ